MIFWTKVVYSLSSDINFMAKAFFFYEKKIKKKSASQEFL